MSSKTLVDILTENGIQLKRSSGERWLAHCPFHEGDRTPSFTVYPNDSYFCFACRAWGDSVKFLMEKNGMSYPQAREYVGEGYTIRRFPKVIKKKDTKGKLWPFLHKVAYQYYFNLLQTPGALSYLDGRGLTRETISKNLLGYTDGAVLALDTEDEMALAVKFDVINDKHYEKMSHRITIPNLPEEGTCDFMIGRTVTHHTIKYLGLSLPKPIYGLNHVWRSPILFHTEGYIDWLILQQWGYPAVTTGGTHVRGVNADVLRERYVVIIPDNDDEGQKAGNALQEQLGERSMVLDYQHLKVKDVGELGPVREAENVFAQTVKEQVAWISSMSKTVLETYFPSLIRQTGSPST